MRFLAVIPAFLAFTLLCTAPVGASDRMPGRIPVSEPKKEESETKPVSPAPKSDDRTAGSKTKAPAPVADKPADSATKKTPPRKAEAEKAEDTPEAPPPVPVVNTPTPNTGMTMAQREMESLGPMTNPLRGSLGSDLWDGSGRPVVHTYIPQMPDGTSLRAAQYLTRRILLTNGDVKMLRGNHSVPAGEDLFTMRIEKLLEIGGYKDAVNLYTLIEGEPSHDRLARAGIYALMLGGAPAQACLEVKAAHRTTTPQPDADIFWPQMDALCTFVKQQSIQSITPSARATLNKDEASVLDSSRILTALVTRNNYRHPVASPDDLDSMSLMERAVLRGLGRLDYSRLKIRKLDQVSAPALMLLATDPNVPEATRFTFNIEAARRGLLDPSQIGEFYLELADGRDDAPGIQGQYLAYTNAEKESQKAAITKSLLENGSGSEQNLLGMLPFASSVPSINPSGLSEKSIESGITLMLSAGMVPPVRWVRAWLKPETADSVQKAEKLRLYLANLLPENLPTESTAFPDEVLKSLLPAPESAELLEIVSLFSGLGRTNALHNVIDTAVYEKLINLTAPNDYVMPRDGLVEKIREASRNGRLGEVALLSTIVLKDYQSGTTHPGVLKELLESLETVGLKEEARHIAMGVMLGLKQ